MRRIQKPVSNRTQKIVYAVATLVLAVLITAGASAFFYEARVLKLVVNRQDVRQASFAEKLKQVVARNSRDLRIAVIERDGEDKALEAFSRLEADLVIARSDQRSPSSARSLADLEVDVAFLISPKSQKLQSLNALRGKRVALWSQRSEDETLLRHILEAADAAPQTVQALSQDVPLERLFAPPAYQAAITIASASVLSGMARSEGFGRRLQAYEVSGVDLGKAIERRVRGVFAESIEPGTISTSPRWPAEAMDTVVARHQLLVRNKVTATRVANLARIIFENKDDLAIERTFATHIEAPETAKDALIVVHPGVAAYLDNDIKGFIDRYGDLFYIGTTAAGLIGSAFVAIYSWITKVTPLSASANVPSITELTDRIREAQTAEELRLLDVELEGHLRELIDGLHHGVVARDGLDVFRIAYDHAHRVLMARQANLTATASVSA